MIDNLLIAFWFFLPAGAANMMPILSTQIPLLKKWRTPMDFGFSFHGKRILGDNKTWRGLVFGIFSALITGWLLRALVFEHITWKFGLSQPELLIAPLMGFGALAGDALESFFKRWRGIDSGKSWYPFDQIDYIIGGLLAVAFVIDITIGLVIYVFIVYFALHLFFSYIGYWLKLKSQPI
ncbi:CDP-archaeol synthase [Candidatus Saccharibacteria bacterium]|nr:CDP-archaeol synthase [Candidatus Saccharibacteria bacterium]MBI3338477.1 CDP-archaeol synthase [Candidatus Saccharibacteria bacterium]